MQYNDHDINFIKSDVIRAISTLMRIVMILAVLSVMTVKIRMILRKLLNCDSGST